MIPSSYLHGVQVHFEVLAHAQITVGTGAVGLPSIPSGDLEAQIKRVVIRNLGQPIQWVGDGSDPTQSYAFPALADEVFVYDGRDLSKFKMVRAPAATADADVRIIYLC